MTWRNTTKKKEDFVGAFSKLYSGLIYPRKKLTIINHKENVHEASCML